MTVAAPYWQKGEDEGRRFITCGNGDKTYCQCSAAALHKLISISQAEWGVDMGGTKINVSLGVMRKRGELGNDMYDKYEQGGLRRGTNDDGAYARSRPRYEGGAG